MARWSVAIPVLLTEGGTPRRALGRSWSLVRGHSGTALAIVLLAAMLTAAGADLPLYLIDDRTAALGVSTLGDAVFQPLAGLAAAVLHARLPREEWVYEVASPAEPTLDPDSPLGRDRPTF